MTGWLAVVAALLFAVALAMGGHLAAALAVAMVTGVAVSSRSPSEGNTPRPRLVK